MQIKIPILDLKKQYAEFKDEAVKKVTSIMDNQDFVLGQEVTNLEKNISVYCNAKYAIGVASGTDALILSLKAAGVGYGDEVITTPFTFIATAEAIVLLGAKPVFADIDKRTYNLDPNSVKDKITPKTKAILPVHLYGLCADMDPIMDLAKRHNLKVIEDAAQAIGSKYKGRMAGAIGDAGAISFFPSKNLGAFGDAGMVVTNDKKIYDEVRLLRVHGSDKRYYHDIIGYNSRLDNLQAAILNIKLRYLDKWIVERKKIALYFNEKLKNLPVGLPEVPEGYLHSYYLYVLRSPDKEKIVEYLMDNGIESRTYYPIPLHKQRCFEYLGYKDGSLPESERAAREAFAIPANPDLTEESRKFIAEKLTQYFK